MATLTENDRSWLARCVDLAAGALAAGDSPFGAVLVDRDGHLRAEAHNRDASSGDPTRHAELELCQWAAGQLSADERAGATIYTSGEPCPMCAAAQGWVGIGRLVFAMSAAQLAVLSSDLDAPAIAPLPATMVAPGLTALGPDPSLSPILTALHRQTRPAPAQRTQSYSMKYAHVERERRFLLAAAPPNLAGGDRIDDAYLTGTRLRLRTVTSPTGVVTHKLGFKVRLDGSRAVACTTMYLDTSEAGVLRALPASHLSKVRHRVDGVGVDVFAGALAGLVLAETQGSEPPTHFQLVNEVTDDDRYSGAGLAHGSVAR